MRTLFFITAFLIFISAKAQNTETDSLKKLLSVPEDGSKRINLLEGLSYAYLDSHPDTSLKYALEGLQLAKNTDNRKGEAICTNALGNVYFHIGDNAKALEFYLQYLKMKEELKDRENIAIAYFNISAVYTEEQDYQHALSYLFKAKKEDEKAKDSSAILYDNYSLATNYQRMQKPDSALFYINQSYAFAKLLHDENMMGAILNTYGETYLSINDTTLALKYYRLSIPYAKNVEDNEVLTSNYYGLAKIFQQKAMFDSSVLYARRALNIARAAPFFKQVLEISGFLTNLFKDKKQFDSAFYYQQLSISTKDSLFSESEFRKVQDLKFNEQQRQQAIETAKIKYHNKIKLYIVIFTAVAFLIITLLLWRNNKREQKANALLQQEKEKVESALSELKSTQAQLIQSEKMASLGELTAGIAHEIQNPLNFVNNFSEVSNELINEMVDEVNKGNSTEAKTVAEDVKQNLEKIIHHGKRADAIVKSMLQHSRKSTGVKEPTDINALCDEYVRLSYHGLRAKDKSFNADFKTDFDNNIEKINIVPQDIGRALLNLFNNAFYAVNEKKKLLADSYQPLVEVKTRRINNKVEITVSDNGSGIPLNIIDKIFQPFFTTKPTGQGTGLGLSLAYDIITKEHNGTIKVESKEGEGSKFEITLPLNQ
jgi:two-component system NtrC family sensor kinase